MDVTGLTESEMAALHDVVQNYLSDLHTEISHTDDRDFKAALRSRQELLQSVLQKLSAPAQQTA